MSTTYWSALIIAHTFFVMCVFYLASKEAQEKTWPTMLIVIYSVLTLAGNITFIISTDNSLNILTTITTLIMCGYASRKVQTWIEGETV